MQMYDLAIVILIEKKNKVCKTNKWHTGSHNATDMDQIETTGGHYNTELGLSFSFTLVSRGQGSTQFH